MLMIFNEESKGLTKSKTD